MTVAELIEQLKQRDPTEVVAFDPNTAFGNLREVTKMNTAYAFPINETTLLPTDPLNADAARCVVLG